MGIWSEGQGSNGNDLLWADQPADVMDELAKAAASKWRATHDSPAKPKDLLNEWSSWLRDKGSPNHLADMFELALYPIKNAYLSEIGRDPAIEDLERGMIFALATLPLWIQEIGADSDAYNDLKMNLRHAGHELEEDVAGP